MQARKNGRSVLLSIGSLPSSLDEACGQLERSERVCLSRKK
jgi:hypothetical protein